MERCPKAPFWNSSVLRCSYSSTHLQFLTHFLPPLIEGYSVGRHGARDGLECPNVIGSEVGTKPNMVGEEQPRPGEREQALEAQKETTTGSGGRANPPSTFCYLSAQRDALGQLVHGHLAVEVTLLGAALHLVDDDGAHHTGDKEGPGTIDDDLQVEWRSHHGWPLFQG